MNEFEIDKHEVRRAFSKAASTYDAAAVLQREVCKRMLEKLDIIKIEPTAPAGCRQRYGLGYAPAG